jgi:hypothetical protein
MLFLTCFLSRSKQTNKHKILLGKYTIRIVLSFNRKYLQSQFAFLIHNDDRSFQMHYFSQEGFTYKQKVDLSEGQNH